MRVNVYAEEMTDRVEIISKTTEDGTFTGLRFYLELPISVPSGGGHRVTHRGPFIHRPGDDDSAAVTFWGKQDLRKVLRTAMTQLDRYYAGTKGDSNTKQVQGQYEGISSHTTGHHDPQATNQR